MDRRGLLAATGALAFAALAGCLGDATDTPGDGAGTSLEPTGDGGTGDPPTADPNVSDGDLQALARDNAAFGLEAYRAVARDTTGDLFLSPFSISAALAMTYAGAAGETAEEMAAVLRFDDDVHPAFAALDHELREREEVEDDDGSVDAFHLRTANALWGQAGVDFAAAFHALVEEYYSAGIAEADFAGNADGERERINEWVADQTEDRIDALLPPGSIDANTILVLTNAIYFLASWESEFDPDDTVDDTFTALGGTESTVPFMHQDMRTPYAAVDGAQAIELPYVGGDVSMVLIRPDTFEDFETVLDADRLFDMFDALADGTGHIALPQFEIETEFELGEVLAELGMERAFSSEADFSEMFANDTSAWIGEVYHDAYVTVDEEGTEAAAATAVVMDESAPPTWGELRFDRPFLFCIRDRPTDSVLFLGRVADPAA